MIRTWPLGVEHERGSRLRERGAWEAGGSLHGHVIPNLSDERVTWPARGEVRAGCDHVIFGPPLSHGHPHLSFPTRGQSISHGGLLSHECREKVT